MENILSNYFESKLEALNCSQRETKTYIVGIFIKYRAAEFDLSKKSITLIYIEAKHNNNFLKYQTLADYIFFCKSLYPEYLNDASQDYYDTIGSLSYNACYKLINRSWPLFKELSFKFKDLTENTRKCLR